MKFFPNFALRDLMLWLGCLLLVVVLAFFLPYGPSVPGFEWDLGTKADPLAPAYPGIKPEWYFLWVYQLLKEFPPHFLGMEGPQACLLFVGALLLVWLLIPWLDRNARRERDSPAVTDLGIAAIVFLSFLTLKAWDVGAELGADDPASRAIAARIAAACVITGFAAVSLLRIVKWRHSWFLFSGIAAAQAALHGFAGLSYLTAGFLALAVGTVAIGVGALGASASGPAGDDS